jgi:sugar phosphate isomerase/epimerase
MEKHKTCLGLNGFGWGHVIWQVPYDFDHILEHTKKQNFDGVELFGLPEPYPTAEREQQALRRRVENHGLRIASVQSLPGGLGNGHPASAYSLCQSQYVEYVKGVLDMAAVLGCETVGVWSGELFGASPSSMNIGFMVDVYGRCAEHAKSVGIPICLEAEPVQQVNTPEIWLQILEGVNSPFMRAICDLSHINILSNRNPLDLLKRIHPYVGHTHLCGNDGTCSNFESRSSTHLLLGEGSMDWQAMLGQLIDHGYKGWLDIDVWEQRDPYQASATSKHVLDEFLARRY